MMKPYLERTKTKGEDEKEERITRLEMSLLGFEVKLMGNSSKLHYTTTGIESNAIACFIYSLIYFVGVIVRHSIIQP